MRETLDAIAKQAERLLPSRPGISEFARRQHDHLQGRLEAAQRIESPALRCMTEKALEQQSLALLAELCRLSAPVAGAREYEHG